MSSLLSAAHIYLRDREATMELAHKALQKDMSSKRKRDEVPNTLLLNKKLDEVITRLNKLEESYGSLLYQLDSLNNLTIEDVQDTIERYLPTNS